MEPDSTAIIATNAIFTAIAAASLALRFWSRHFTSAGYAADDWLAVASFGFSSALAITNILGIPLGSFGSKFEKLTDAQAVSYLKFFFAIQFWYIAALAAVKLTALYLSKRIFSGSRTPIVIWVLISLSIGWAVSFLAATLFQILPIWCNWVACIPTSNYPLMYLMSSVTDLTLDIFIFCLPILFIRNLHMPSARKIGIAGIFGLGLFCIVASAARLYYTWTYLQANIAGDYASNFDESADNVIMWSGIEACVSSICANLPTYGPLFNAPRGCFTIPSLISRTSHGRGNTGVDSESSERHWPRKASGGPANPASKVGSSPLSKGIRPLERSCSLAGEDLRHSRRFFTRIAASNELHDSSGSPPRDLRYSESKCPIQMDHDCLGAVHQTVELSVVRTNNRNDGEFRILPCSPVEAAMGMS